MFFAEKIISIGANDKVLEIGPGSDPFHRSDVLLELDYKNDEERIKQFGHAQPLNSSKQVVYYDGTIFPFADKSFDYVICSHVLEHIENVDLFLSEIFRIAKRGYFEYPLVTYDYLYNFDVHLNFIRFNGKEMLLMKKNKTELNQFHVIQSFFLKTLQSGYGDFLTKIPENFFQGFEWHEPFKIRQTDKLEDLVVIDFNRVNANDEQISIKQSSKLLMKAIINRIKR